VIDDLTARRYSEKAQKAYVRRVRTFAAFLGGRRTPRRAMIFAAFNCIWRSSRSARIDQRRHRRAAVLFHRNARTARPRTSSKARERAAQGPGRAEPGRGGATARSRAGLKYKAALCVAYSAGLRVSEVAYLKVSDVDSQRMRLRVEQGKGQRDRYVMLSPQLLELLREWWRAARPPVWLPCRLQSARSRSRTRLRSTTSCSGPPQRR
jgi:integrase